MPALKTRPELDALVTPKLKGADLLVAVDKTGAILKVKVLKANELWSFVDFAETTGAAHVYYATREV